MKKSRGSQKWVVWLLVGVGLLVAGGAFFSLALGKRDERSQVPLAVEQLKKMDARLNEIEKRLGVYEGMLGAMRGELDATSNTETLLKSTAKRFDHLEKRIDTLAKRFDKDAIDSKQVLHKKTVSTKKPGYHVVRQGDTLFRIGKVYGLSPKELARINRLSEASQIYVGQKLQVSR